MKNINYSAIFQPEPEGGYTVIVPSLPGCISYGKTIEEAREMIQDAISLYLKSLQSHRDLIPKETFVPFLSNIMVKSI